MNFNTLKPTGNATRALVVFAAGLLPTAVLSGEVSLKSADGTVNIVGEFVDFADDHYVVRTALGDLRIAASRVRCEGADCPSFDTASADVMFAGSDTVGLGLMPLLMSGYASHLDAEASVVATSNEGEVITTFVGDGGFGDEMGSYLVTSTSSGTAFKALKAGTAQIGMASRRIKPQEARDLKKEGAGNMISPQQEHIVAVDSLVVITHPSNPVSNLSMEQLREVYAGNITNWSELGGDDQPIKVIGRQASSGTNSVFKNAVFGDSGLEIKANVIVAKDNNEMASMVNSDPTAVGFVGYAFQRGAKPVTLTNDCGIPMTPDSFSAKTEEYALQRRLYLYNRADLNSGQASDFMTYAMSKDADGVIAKAGFIDLGIKTREQTMDGDRARTLLDTNVDAFEGGVMREMLSQMVDYDRLSTTFRFKTGSSRMDERAAIDMARLVEYLKEQPEGVKVKFVGFTDSIGAFESNRALSRGRAGEVLKTVTAAAEGQLDHVAFEFDGFGEIAPSACNTNENGRAINRRVEVWIEKVGRS